MLTHGTAFDRWAWWDGHLRLLVCCCRYDGGLEGGLISIEYEIPE